MDILDGDAIISRSCPHAAQNMSAAKTTVNIRFAKIEICHISSITLTININNSAVGLSSTTQNKCSLH
jgi:hypothetical protein